MKKSTILSIVFIATLVIMNMSYISIFTEPENVISHDEALAICEDLNITYDYESLGYTPKDFCN